MQFLVTVPTARIARFQPSSPLPLAGFSSGALNSGRFVPQGLEFFALRRLSPASFLGRKDFQVVELLDFGFEITQFQITRLPDRSFDVITPAYFASGTALAGAMVFTLTGLAGMPTEIVKGCTSLVATPIEPSSPCSWTRTPLITVA